MATYEITAVVNENLTAQYEAYMIERHIPDVLATGFFTSATISRHGDRYRIRYETTHESEIDQYLTLRAARLRTDFNKNFPTGIELSREVWEVIFKFDAPE